MDSDDVKKFLAGWLISSAIWAGIAWWYSTSLPFDYSDALILSAIAIGWFSLPPIPFFVYFFSSELEEEMQVWFTVIAALFVATFFASFLPSIVPSYVLMPPSLVAEVLSVFGASLAVTIALPLAWLALSSLCERFDAFLRYWIPTFGVFLVFSLLLWFFPSFLPAYLPSSVASLASFVSVAITAGWLVLPPAINYAKTHAQVKHKQVAQTTRAEEEEEVDELLRVLTQHRWSRTKLVESNVWVDLTNKTIQYSDIDGHPYLEVSLSYRHMKRKTTVISLEDLKTQASELKADVLSSLARAREKNERARRIFEKEFTQVEPVRKENRKKMKAFRVRAGEPLTAAKELEKLLSSNIQSGEVLLYDSYIDPRTLHPLTALKGKATALKILALEIHDRQKFDDYRKKLEDELGIRIEVRTNPKVHERFLINKERCWSIGSSLNDLGRKKDATIEPADVKLKGQMFWEEWKEGIPQ